MGRAPARAPAIKYVCTSVDGGYKIRLHIRGWRLHAVCVCDCGGGGEEERRKKKRKNGKRKKIVPVCDAGGMGVDTDESCTDESCRCSKYTKAKGGWRNAEEGERMWKKRVKDARKITHV